MKSIPGLNNYQGQRLKKIDRKAVSTSSQVVFDLPQDIVAKGFILIHEANIAATYASTTPVIHPRGVFHAMCSNLELARSGNDVLKVFRGVAQLQDQAQWVFGEPAPTLYKVNDTELDGSEVSGLPTFGTTTQVTAIREAIYMPCENILSSEYVNTCLNLSGINTAKIRISLGSAALMQSPSDAASATFAYTSGYISIYAITADHLGDAIFDDWKQYYDEITFAAQANRSVVELRPLGLVQGFHLRAFKGNGYKELNNAELKAFEIEIKFNDNVLFEGNLADFQSLNGSKSSMRSFLRSSAYLNCLNNSTYSTGLETGQDAKAVTPLRLTVTTPSSINHSTDPVRLVADYDVIVKRK